MSISELDNHKTDELFWLLSNKIRFDILKECSQNHSTVSELAKSLRVPQYVINKHLMLLLKESLIEKNSRAFYLSSFGSLILQKCSCISFLNENKEFFEDHDFCEIPSQFIQRIGDLHKSQLFKGAHIMYSHWTEICNEAKKHIFCIFSYPPILVSHPIKEKIQDGVLVRLLFAKGSKNLEISEFVQNLGLNNHINYQNLEKRRNDKVLPNLLITEKKATLMFPDGKGSTDFHSNFESTNHEFCKWCLDLFNHEWVHAEPFSRFAKKSIDIK